MTEHLASVFLSYAWADKPLARGLAEGLDASGCRVWIDEGELRVGDSWCRASATRWTRWTSWWR